jgi:hypothetical protein
MVCWHADRILRHCVSNTGNSTYDFDESIKYMARRKTQFILMYSWPSDILAIYGHVIFNSKKQTHKHCKCPPKKHENCAHIWRQLTRRNQLEYTNIRFLHSYLLGPKEDLTNQKASWKSGCRHNTHQTLQPCRECLPTFRSLFARMERSNLTSTVSRTCLGKHFAGLVSNIRSHSAVTKQSCDSGYTTLLPNFSVYFGGQMSVGKGGGGVFRNEVSHNLYTCFHFNNKTWTNTRHDGM